MGIKYLHTTKTQTQWKVDKEKEAVTVSAAVVSAAVAVEVVTDQVAADAVVPLRTNGSPRPNLAASSRVISSNHLRKSTLTQFPSRRPRSSTSLSKALSTSSRTMS